MRRSTMLVTSLIAATMLVPVSSASAVDDINTKKLRNAVSVSGILQHERALQQIAYANGGTRASGTPGYAASADYVKQQLAGAGYLVSEQTFTFPFFRELAPAEVSQLTPTPTDYESATLTYSGSGDVSGVVVPALNVAVPIGDQPPNTSAAGCAPADFAPASDTEDQIALVQRGTCDFATKTANAGAAGYDAVLIFNEGQQDQPSDRFGLLTNATLGAPVDFPVVGLSYTDGAALVEAARVGEVTARVATATEGDPNATTTNIIADSPAGNPDKVVVVGAHLDSVTEGPGINDNGSGTAVILETAIQMAKIGVNPRQQVRFAFWGAEESGLLGSEHYVSSLDGDALSKIYANLNFDMLGSPNYVRFVYDGDGSGDPQAGGPPGSAQIEQIFTDYFTAQGLATAPTAFDGRSDYGPFIAAGIPAGGLFSGAEGIKTDQEAVDFGGVAGQPYDACYHQACDNINNLSTKALFELGDAAAHAVMTLARSKSGFFEDGSRMAARQAITMEQFDYKGSHLVR